MGRDLEIKISQFLRWGVIVAASLLLLGWIGSHSDKKELSAFVDYHPQMLQETIQWTMITKDNSKLISYVGIFALLLLPVVRVFMTGLLLVKQKEYFLGATAFLVFTLILMGFRLGI